jgi:hypothetical protein
MNESTFSTASYVGEKRIETTHGRALSIAPGEYVEATIRRGGPVRAGVPAPGARPGERLVRRRGVELRGRHRA